MSHLHHHTHPNHYHRQILTLIYEQVTLKSTVSTVVVTTLVLEGWSRELNPDLHIMDTLRDMLAADWKERLSRAVDKVRGCAVLLRYSCCTCAVLLLYSAFASCLPMLHRGRP